MKRLEEKRKEARRLYAEGMTYNVLCQKLNVSKSSISYWCSDLAREKRQSITGKTEEKKEKLKIERQERKERQSRENKGIPGKHPYLGYLVYVEIGKDNVIRCHMYNPTTKHSMTMSYPRYQMAVKEGRILNKEEIVVYKQGPRDDVNSYVVMTQEQKNEEYRKSMERKCAHLPCSKTFVAKRKESKFCSVDCRVDNGRIVPIKRTPKLYKRECVICESTFESPATNAEICSERCRSILKSYNKMGR